MIKSSLFSPRYLTLIWILLVSSCPCQLRADTSGYVNESTNTLITLSSDILESEVNGSSIEWTTESTISNEEDVDDVDEEAVELRAISLFWGAYGTLWPPKVIEIEEKILNYYKSELNGKTEQCKWTDKDRESWDKKLKEIRGQVGNLTQSNDRFGLEEFRVKEGELKDYANWTLDILEDMEKITNALVLGAESDSVVLIYGGYLREKMLQRRLSKQLIECEWTTEDRKRADKKIGKMFARIVGQVFKELAEQFEVKVKDIVTENERKSIKELVRPHKKNFENLFQPFESDE